MLTAITFFLFISAILAAILLDLPILLPIVFGSLLFGTYALLSGNSLSAVLNMMKKGIRKGIFVFLIFILIGMVTASWRASGTVAFFVYWGTKIIRPQWFLLCAFLLTSAMAYIAGTSFGTIGTLGVMLMILARTGNVNPLMTAGAIIGGSYIGDRGSPASSSAILISRLTGTDLMSNVRRMLRTGLVPFLLCCAFYAFLSPGNPLTGSAFTGFEEIRDHYALSFLSILPALVVLILPPLKIDIRITMGTSLLLAVLLAVFLQHDDLLSVLKALIVGYTPFFEGELASLLRGGGLASMLQASCVVLAASTYDGIFSDTGILTGLESVIQKIADRLGLFPATVITAIVTSMVACNQTLAVMMTQELMEPPATHMGVLKEDQALNLENTVITIAPLIPWNIAVSAGLSVLNTGAGAIPYAAFLYFVPLCGLISHMLRRNSASR